MLTDEGCEPYEKPPLSKAVLTGKVTPHDAPIAGPKGLAGFGITLTCRARVREIDRAARAVVTEAGERIAYDALVLATGANNRILPMFPPGPGIYYLRTEAEAMALKAHLDRSKSLLVIGGGLIGLEVAASAAELGIKTTVIEIAPRILARVCDEETSALIHEAPPRARRRYSRSIPPSRRCTQQPDGGFADRDQNRRDHHGRPDRGRRRRGAGEALAQVGGARRAGRHHRRRPWPHLRSGDFCGRRLHALSRAARAGAAGELAARAGARRYRRPQRRRRRRRLQRGAIVLVGAIRPLHPGHGLAGGAAAARGYGARSGRRRSCCSNSTARKSATPWASTRSATSPWRAA